MEEKINNALGRLKDLNILIVEPDFSERIKLLKILDQYGLKKRSVYSNIKDGAQDVLSGHQYDLIFVSESPEALQCINKMSQLKTAMPIVFVSYGCSMSSAFKAFEAGAADVINKPYRIEEVEKLLLASIKIDDFRKDLKLNEYFSFKNQIFFRLQQA